MHAKKQNNLIPTPLLAICIIFSLLRIWASWLLGNVVPNNDTYDSLLMVEYSNIFDHFWAPSETSLVKTMSYPLFLLLPSLTGVSYNVLLSLFWIIAGIICVHALKRVTSRTWFLTFAYLFIIWTPIAFEVWAGVRIYRNAIIVPAFFLLFGLLFLFVSNCLAQDKPSFCAILTAFFTGVVFVFDFYIKEDGFWMIPLLAIVMTICVVSLAYRAIKMKLSWKHGLASLVIILLPLIIFQTGTALYKGINDHYFGVNETNTRTEGALGEFVKNIYRIDSEDQTRFIWAPYDAIEKAFDASETLSLYPELETNLLNNIWFKKNDIQEPIPGDFLGWVLRTSLVETGIWENEAQIQRLFEQVNSELDTSFNNGTLKESSSFTLTSSAGPRTFPEIFDLIDDTFLAFSSPLFFQGYRMDASTYRASGVINPTETELYRFNQYTGSITDPGLLKEEGIKIWIGSFFSSVDLMIYKILAPLSIIFALFGVITTILRYATKREQITMNQGLAVVVAIGLLLMAFVYSFGISWFCEWIYEGYIENASIFLTFYGVGVIPMLYLAILFGGALGAEKARVLFKFGNSK